MLDMRWLRSTGDEPSCAHASFSLVHGATADTADRPHLQHNAVCLETQHFPDAVNKDAWRDSVLLMPGETYLQRSRHVFGVCE